KEVVVVDVPAMKFLMIDGAGNPNTSSTFQEATEALFAVSYGLKFMIKKGEQQVDYGVMPLEGLWWADDMAQFSVEKKGDWKWTLMMMQPEYVTPDLFAEAVEQVKKKKNPAALPLMRFEAYTEGQAAQIMHIGPFSEEGPTVAKIHDFIVANGGKLAGKHHEIYLSDIRKAAPDKWKTVIRQPFK
ncbi:MAG: GyrI-like domain-containing protein, partial [Anaerolineae bacterium]